VTAPRRRFEELSARLAKKRLGECELYLKEGRSRRVELGPQGLIEVRSQEAGWAVRAGGRKGSFFACGTGEPDPAGPWPDAAGEALQLPGPREVEPLPDPVEAPLHVEAEAVQRLETFAAELGRELPGARLVHIATVRRRCVSRSSPTGCAGRTGSPPARPARSTSPLWPAGWRCC
jgi:hypothetical protein